MASVNLSRYYPPPVWIIQRNKKKHLYTPRAKWQKIQRECFFDVCCSSRIPRERKFSSTNSSRECVNSVTMHNATQLTCNVEYNVLHVVAFAVDRHVRGFALVEALVFQLDVGYLQIRFRRIRRIFYVGPETFTMTARERCIRELRRRKRGGGFAERRLVDLPRQFHQLISVDGIFVRLMWYNVTKNLAGLQRKHRAILAERFV